MRGDMTFDAVVLAGGKSTRMGRDKALIQVNGQTLLARQIELARQAAASEIFISGRPDTDYSEFRCRVLKDEFPHAGPLAGIERALATATRPLLLVLAVDLPGMKANLLRTLLAACSGNCGAIPCIGGEIEPLAAFYPKMAHSLSLQLLAQNIFAVKRFTEACVQLHLAQFIDLSAEHAECFVNWNTPSAVSELTVVKEARFESPRMNP
jgi:molybdopterin-guanine dinucleotide biosynthesis protein A